MGTALDKGDIDLMTRTMSPEQIRSSRTTPTGDIDLVEMPGLEIRYLAFNTNAPTVKNKAVRQAMAQIINRGELVSKVYGDEAEPLYSLVPASITGHTNSFFNKYGEPSDTKAKTLLEKAGHHHPGEVDPALHDRPLRPGHRKEFEVLKKQLNAAGCSTSPSRAPLGTVPPGRAEGRVRRLRHGLVPGLPRRRQLPRAVPRQGQLPQHAVRRTP